MISFTKIMHPISKKFSVGNLATKNTPFSSFLNKKLNCCHIHKNSLVPKGTIFPHGVGIVIGEGVKIGKNVTIYQNVTLGTKNGGYPEIGDNVVIYPSSIIVGGIKIGKNSIIGAGSFIDCDIPKNSIVKSKNSLVISKNEN